MDNGQLIMDNAQLTMDNAQLIMKNIPKLRFPDFQGEWEEKKLGELLEFKNGINAAKEQYGKGVKFINVLDILNNDFITHDVIIGSVDVDNETVEKYPVSYGDILFQRSSETREEVGTACVYLDKEKTATFGGFVIRGKKIGEYEPIFLNKLLKTDLSRNEITSKSGGSTRYNVGQEILFSVSLPFPTLPEQQKIASFLTAVDEKLQALKKKKNLLEQYKKGIMQQIFSQQLRFQDEKGENFADWEEKKLGEVGKFQAGGDLSKLDYQKEKSEKYPYPIFANGAGDGLYGFASSFQYKENSVTVSGRGNLGYAKFRKERFNAIVRLIVIIPNENINPKFLEEAINKMNFAIESTGVPQLTVPQISNYIISLPSLPEQQKIAQFLTAIDEKISHCQAQIAKMTEWKKGLLQQLFV